MIHKLARLVLCSVALSLVVAVDGADAQSMKMNVFIASSPPASAVETLDDATAHCYDLGYAMGASDLDWRAYLRVDGEAPEAGEGPWFNYQGEQVAVSLNELLGPKADRSRLMNDRGTVPGEVEPVETLDPAGTTGHFVCYAHPWN